MCRLFGLRPLFIFLVAIGTNGVQASQVTLDPVRSEVAGVNAVGSPNTSGSESFLMDDDSDDVLPVLRLRHIAVPSLEPDSGYFDFQLTYLPGLPFSRHTILQI